MKFKGLILCLLALVFYKNTDAKEKTIILINPSFRNLERIVTLVEKKYINIPDLKIIGVFNNQSEYDYNSNSDYISKHSFLSLEGYNFSISMDSLYMTNSCTKTFYQLFKRSDGIMFWGGDDIPPKTYNEKTNLLTGCFTQDRLYEVSLMFHLIGGSRNTAVKAFLEERPDYAVLGICLGLQIMNVAAGGSLYQDIPTEIYKLKHFEEVTALAENNIHRNYWKGFIYDDSISNYCFHKFKIFDKSILKEIAKGDFQPTVLSYHHQCIKKTGTNLKITASSLDGKVIEGIEHLKYKNVYGVQFHPEYKVLYDNNEKVRMKPGEKPSGSDKLLDDNSRLFYKSFWKYFSELITAN